MKKHNEQRGYFLQHDRVLFIVQVLIYFFCAIPLRIIYRSKIKYTASLDNLRKGSLFVSNHQSKVDPFLILACLPPRDYLRTIPVRFPLTEDFFSSKYLNPRLFPILTILGCFSAGSTTYTKMHTVFYIRKLLKQNKTIMIFPEGKISTEISILDFKKGVDFFIKSAHSVIFIRLGGFKNNKKHRGEKVSHVTFGEVFSPPPEMSSHDMKNYLEKLDT